MAAMLAVAPGWAANRAAGDPGKGLRASVSVTLTVLPWVYVTPMTMTDLVLPSEEQGQAEDASVLATFVLPASMGRNAPRWAEATVNGVQVMLDCQSTSPQPAGDETVYRLSVPRGELVSAIGDTPGTHDVRLDVPLASGDAISCCGQVELRTPPRPKALRLASKKS